MAKKINLPHRIVLLGASGSGKSWLAQRLAARHNLPLITLDNLAWDPDWVLVDDPTYLARVQTALHQAGDHWIIDGNYGKGQHLYWNDTQLVIWLDLPFIPVITSLVGRAIRQIHQKTPLCNGNRQTLRQFFWGPNNLFGWVLRTFWRRRRRNAATMQADVGHPTRRWIRLASRQAATSFTL